MTLVKLQTLEHYKDTGERKIRENPFVFSPHFLFGIRPGKRQSKMTYETFKKQPIKITKGRNLNNQRAAKRRAESMEP